MDVRAEELLLLNCGAGEDSYKSLGQQGQELVQRFLFILLDSKSPLGSGGFQGGYYQKCLNTKVLGTAAWDKGQHRQTIDLEAREGRDWAGGM